MTNSLKVLVTAVLVGLAGGIILAAFIVSSALAFVIGRWSARLLGWY